MKSSLYKPEMGSLWIFRIRLIILHVKPFVLPAVAEFLYRDRESVTAEVSESVRTLEEGTPAMEVEEVEVKL